MHTEAAVVRSFDAPPRYEQIDVPDPTDREVALDVLAVGLHPRVRSGASGAHYTSSGRLPMVPGVDGVGRLDDGSLVYFAVDDDVSGSMARRLAVDPRRTVPLPAGTDPVLVAAAMNPAMSSWTALRRRTRLQPGQSVLVLGATGNAGGMALQVARLLGAGRVVGAGRDAAALARLDADATVRLDQSETAAALADAAAEVDVVVDYLWGPPAMAAMEAILRARSDRSRPLDWVQVGSVAGRTAELPSALLRQAGLRVMGSGQGSVSLAGYVAELPALVEQLAAGALTVRTRTAPLADVERVWGEPDEQGVRTVLVA
ncbi:zinc-binding alcohol dehydrogenase family protein [Cellulomonas sp. HZM]|uniref:quinone oxidoreductase family protein n=1 Tax=Cellulomonas sp. HZM TaxID=1454010 RepID=UPI00049350A9|nr:zinc-binding alcohol dehydrogenase family protein [Cellulomonas sp. HZM]